MTSVPLSNVLLPAVFISSAVFSTLTVPFAFIKSEPVVVEIPPFFSGEIQPIFDGEHKDVAIPYVGFAIVVSVGAGIASVEVNRRWQAYRESAMTQEQLPSLQQNSREKEAQQEALKLPEYRPEVSAISFSPNDEVFRSQSLSDPDTMTEASLLSVEEPEKVIDITQLFVPQPTLPDQTTASVPDLEKLDLSQELHGNNSGETRVIESLLSSQGDEESNVQEKDLAESKILESRHLYKTRRINVPHLERRLFAILVNGEYYSFFRAEKTWEKVQDVMAKLGHKVQKTAITKTEKGYVIWTFEPEVSSNISS
jgi:hypothetical protein